jgi:hypothetical protein
MKQIIATLCLLLLCSPVVLAADSGSVEEYRQIIKDRCTSCHEAGRIEKAMAEGQNIGEILNKMQRMGAELTPRDKSVLGIFWGSPLKK